MALLGPNADLIGRPGSRADLCTPALVLDLAAFERNLLAMAAWCDRHGVALRPHAKTHKSVEVARRQLGAGAIGNAVATIGEAERLTGGGIGNLLITSPLATPAKLARLRALLERAEGLMVVADSVAGVDALAEAVQGTDRRLIVLVDVGVGRQRTGCTSPEQALAVARRIAASEPLSFGGVQAYAGHLQHTVEFAERARQDEVEYRRAGATIERLRADGLAPRIVTGAGTGSHAIDGGGGLFTELQCGSYVFMDVWYQQVTLRPDDAQPFEPALFVRTSVISANAAAHVTTDAGLKHFATDGPRPVIARGAPDGAEYHFFGDEHGRIELADAARHLPVGTALECITPHCDPTVNLYDVYHVVHGDMLVDIWPIDARGAI
ncbi:MAG TPA: DSD1 family PLP-dependent enzyme [Geminicoccaceae bacterium]|nr:DSD1 family PLP-dependent enzyme [Geminicoccaceae bacterium]